VREGGNKKKLTIKDSVDIIFIVINTHIRNKEIKIIQSRYDKFSPDYAKRKNQKKIKSPLLIIRSHATKNENVLTDGG
jgi:hypothetical protein